MSKTWAEIFIDALRANHVKRIYGYPWGANIPLYDKMAACKEIEHILVRHEQAAAFGAQWQSRTSDDVWVCLVTSWPWAANALTGVYDAYMDNIPMIFITAQVSRSYMGNDVFQEMDTIGATMSFTKHGFLISDVNEIPFVINEAFRLALSGRPWPVHIDFPKDIQNALYTWNTDLVGFDRTQQPHHHFSVSEMQIACVYEALKSAKKPVFLIGQGIKLAWAIPEVNALVEALGIPTVHTLHAKGIIPSMNPYLLNMVGMHGYYHANQALFHADVILNVGSRFDDRIVGTYESFAKHAKVIHVDVDKSELGKLVGTDLAIHADAKHFLTRMLEKNPSKLEIAPRWQEIHEWNQSCPFQEETEHFSPKNALQILTTFTQTRLNDFIFVTDVGQHQMWAAQVIKVPHARAWLTSGGAGTMGFALPTAVGAALTHPEKTVVVIAGDGGIQMNIQELQLLKDYGLDIKVIILNNHFLGMVRQWQDMFYEKNYSQTPISSPNFPLLAEAYGLKWYRAYTPEALKKVLSEAFSNRQWAVIEVKVEEREDNIFPMVPPWSRLDQTIHGNMLP